MVDIFPEETRSRIMSKIRGTDTSPEMLVRRGLFKNGYRYRVNYWFKGLRFKPDIVMISRKVCIFIDGCFWHKCPICYRQPKSNKRYWIAKINRNMRRDKKQNKFLEKQGWRIIRVWEHEVMSDLNGVLEKIISYIS